MGLMPLTIIDKNRIMDILLRSNISTRYEKDHLCMHNGELICCARWILLQDYDLSILTDVITSIESYKEYRYKCNIANEDNNYIDVGIEPFTIDTLSMAMKRIFSDPRIERINDRIVNIGSIRIELYSSYALFRYRHHLLINTIFSSSSIGISMDIPIEDIREFDRVDIGDKFYIRLVYHNYTNLLKVDDWSLKTLRIYPDTDYIETFTKLGVFYDN